MLNHHPHFKLFIKPRAGAACTSFLINSFLDRVVVSLLSLPPSTRSNQSHVCLWSDNYPSQSKDMFGRLREKNTRQTRLSIQRRCISPKRKLDVRIKAGFGSKGEIIAELVNQGQVFQMARVNQFAYAQDSLCAWVSRT